VLARHAARVLLWLIPHRATIPPVVVLTIVVLIIALEVGRVAEHGSTLGKGQEFVNSNQASCQIARKPSQVTNPIGFFETRPPGSPCSGSYSSVVLGLLLIFE
jgi:hypothetical protein